MKTLHIVSLVLVVIGAINWGLVGLFGFDAVAQLFGGEMEPMSRIIYTLVGIAGIIIAITSSALPGGVPHSAEQKRHHAA